MPVLAAGIMSAPHQLSTMMSSIQSVQSQFAALFSGAPCPVMDLGRMPSPGQQSDASDSGRKRSRDLKMVKQIVRRQAPVPSLGDRECLYSKATEVCKQDALSLISVERDVHTLQLEWERFQARRLQRGLVRDQRALRRRLETAESESQERLYLQKQVEWQEHEIQRLSNECLQKEASLRHLRDEFERRLTVERSTLEQTRDQLLVQVAKKDEELRARESELVAVRSSFVDPNRHREIENRVQTLQSQYAVKAREVEQLKLQAQAREKKIQAMKNVLRVAKTQLLEKYDVERADGEEDSKKSRSS